jgi:hypothetical protein
MDRTHYYLRIPEAYCRGLGGLCWAASREAIEYADVGTFAFSAEVGLFLEGFATVRPPVHFVFVLHLLHLLGYGKLAPPVEAAALRTAFREAGRPIRNAGALCGFLCQDMPSLAEPVDVNEVCGRLAGHSHLPPNWFVLSYVPDAYVPNAEQPPLGPGLFERWFLGALANLPPDDLRYWLCYGREPMADAGQKLAEELVAVKPRTLSGTLAALAQSPRLAGAVPYVAQLVSALALPPRRLAEEELPTGGYADVATRGQPERILPSQFAMDPLEFIRRYAAHELLYFRREEPQTRTREDLVVVLDQGVRTWGSVRLLLSAAALALGKMAVRKKLPLLLAGTSSAGRLLDPVQDEEQAVVRLVEASDLSANPGLALESVLEGPCETARDVVLLTHPRNLAEPDVVAAARRAGGKTRLFSVAVDGQGRVQVSALRHGAALPLSQFHVEKVAAPSPPAEEPGPATEAGDPLRPWQGDVEPVGFPFRLGVTDRLHEDLFDFDYAGEWLLALGANGMLHLCRLDGTRAELLPRPMVGGELLTRFSALRGVAGGFVIAGRMRECTAIAHYDLGSRRCTVYVLDPLPARATWMWFYFREHHSLVFRTPGTTALAVDLATGEVVDHATMAGRSERAFQACREASGYMVPPPRVLLRAAWIERPGKRPDLYLNEGTGCLILDGANPPWVGATPLADGKPMLKGWSITRAVYCNGILAALCSRPGQKILRLFRGPDCTPLLEYSPETSDEGIALSPDGKLLAVQRSRGWALVVRDVGRDGATVYETSRARFHTDLSVRLGHDWLAVETGRFSHLFRWAQGPLAHTCWHTQSVPSDPVASLDLCEWTTHRLVPRVSR